MYTMKEIRDQFAALKPSKDAIRATRLNVFKPYYQRFLEAPKFQAKEVSMNDIDEFGSRLQRQAELNTVCNENVSFSGQIGGAQTSVGLDYVTASEIENPLPLMAVSQTGDEATMTDKFGVVRYEKIVAKTTKGNVSEGDVLMGAVVGPDKYATGFATEMHYDEVFATVASGNTTTTFTGATDAKPIRPYYLQITLPGGGLITDDGAGHLIGNEGYGTINYTTGAITLNLAAAPAAGDILLTYADNMELGAVPVVGVEMEGKLIKANVYGLQSDTSILSSYLMKKMFDFDLQARAIQVVQQNILNEMVTDLIKKLEKVIIGNNLNVTQFDLTKPQAISQQAHNETVDIAFKQVEKKMAKLSNHGDLNVALCGMDASTIVGSLSKFRKTGKISAFATLYGVYDEKTIVINCPQLTAGKIIFLGKDEASAFCAAACQMICMPLVTAADIPASYNLSQRLNGCFTLAAVDVLNPQMVQAFNFVNTPFPA